MDKYDEKVHNFSINDFQDDFTLLVVDFQYFLKRYYIKECEINDKFIYVFRNNESNKDIFCNLNELNHNELNDNDLNHNDSNHNESNHNESSHKESNHNEPNHNELNHNEILMIKNVLNNFNNKNIFNHIIKDEIKASNELINKKIEDMNNFNEIINKKIRDGVNEK